MLCLFNFVPLTFNEKIRILHCIFYVSYFICCLFLFTWLWVTRQRNRDKKSVYIMMELLTSLVMAKPLHIMTWNCYRHQMDNYRKLHLYSSFYALLEYITNTRHRCLKTLIMCFVDFYVSSKRILLYAL